MIEKIKEAITRGRVYQCRLCGKQYIERALSPQCQHDFLLVELKDKDDSIELEGGHNDCKN